MEMGSREKDSTEREREEGIGRQYRGRKRRE